MINMHKLHEGDSLPEGRARGQHHARKGRCCPTTARSFLLPRD